MIPRSGPTTSASSPRSGYRRSIGAREPETESLKPSVMLPAALNCVPISRGVLIITSFVIHPALQDDQGPQNGADPGKGLIRLQGPLARRI
jgi:hypothetical protein